jgi:hypothetical protein
MAVRVLLRKKKEIELRKQEKLKAPTDGFSPGPPVFLPP